MQSQPHHAHIYFDVVCEHTCMSAATLLGVGVDGKQAPRSLRLVSFGLQRLLLSLHVALELRIVLLEKHQLSSTFWRHAPNL